MDIPILVQLNITFEKKYKYNEDLAHDISSSIFTLAIFLGEALGPIFGGYLSYKKSFEFSCYITGLINLVYSCFLTILYRQELLEKINYLKARFLKNTKNKNENITNKNDINDLLLRPDTFHLEQIEANEKDIDLKLKKIGSFNINKAAALKASSFNSLECVKSDTERHSDDNYFKDKGAEQKKITKEEQNQTKILQNKFTNDFSMNLKVEQNQSINLKDCLKNPLNSDSNNNNNLTTNNKITHYKEREIINKHSKEDCKRDFLHYLEQKQNMQNVYLQIHSPNKTRKNLDSNINICNKEKKNTLNRENNKKKFCWDKKSLFD